MTEALQATDNFIECIELSEFVPCADALACLTCEVAMRSNVLPVAIVVEGATTVLLLACLDVNDQALKERVRRHIAQSYELRFIGYSGGQLLPTIVDCYRPHVVLDELLALASERECYARASSAVPDFPVALVNAVIVQAASMNASDIHVSPEATRVQIRLRVDGVLLNFASIDKSILGSLLIRIKIMSSLDIAETRYPQDGQFRRVIRGRNVDFRVSTFPTVDGENTVLRLIDGQMQRHSVSALNLPAHLHNRLTAIMRNPQGLVIVCGPTGSGKSTTLFALLDTIDRNTRSVMTLEDPVEHRIAGVRQTTIDASRQWGYSHGLKALLRQDPDVLLIGEVRDLESCRMSMRAVSTGHQVLTTVHAADAHAALNRLRELGAERAALADGLVAVIAQRLVRRVCGSCHGVEGVCDKCHGTGYSGRQVVMELLEITDDIKHLLSQGADVADIRQTSRCNGFVDLYEQAMLQVAAGITTGDEVTRVLGDNAECIG